MLALFVLLLLLPTAVRKGSASPSVDNACCSQAVGNAGCPPPPSCGARPCHAAEASPEHKASADTEKVVNIHVFIHALSILQYISFIVIVVLGIVFELLVLLAATAVRNTIARFRDILTRTHEDNTSGDEEPAPSPPSAQEVRTLRSGNRY